MHWLRERGKFWPIKTLSNGIGALATMTTLVVVIFSKFLEGAWITVLLILLIVMIFQKTTTIINSFANNFL
ncbi:MAG: hypothetical protein ABSA01_09845 [Anaerolineales bacterium]